MRPRKQRKVGTSHGAALRNQASTGAFVDLLESRVLLTAAGTLTPIADFNGTDGFSPAAVVSDAAGNLFGITNYTQNGDQTGSGVVFEIAAGTNTITDLASLGPTSSPIIEGRSLIIDSSGNLFGTTSGNLTAGAGSTVFEIAHGTSTMTTVATFPAPGAGAAPQGSVTAVDSSGDLFGIDSASNIFEIVNGSQTITSNLFGISVQTLEIGPDGNFYGIGNGIVEISSTTGQVQTLGTFDSGTTGNTPLGIAFDSSNNLWGFCQYGGPDSTGTIWEIPAGTTTINLVASFTNDSGTNPVSRPVIDSSNILFGLAQNGGANGEGTVFSFDTTGAVTTAAIHPAAEVEPAGVIDQADFGQSSSPGSGSGVVSGYQAGYYPDYRGRRIIVFVPTGSLASDKKAQELGDVVSVIYNNQVAPPAGITFEPSLSPLDELKQALQNAANQLAQQASELAGSAAQASIFSRRADELSQSTEHADVVSGLKAEVAQIRTMLNTARRELKTGDADVSKLGRLATPYNALGAQVTALNTQLSVATSASVIARLEKRGAADDAAQIKLANKYNALYTTANDQATTLTTLVANIQSSLDTLPPPTILFGGTIATVPDSAQPGKKATAVVTLSNGGNITASGSLDIAVFLRPQGTTGDSDITLPDVPARVHLAPGASHAVKLPLTIPTTVPAGTYVLVVQLDPANTFPRASAPSPIVGAQALAVT